MRYENNHWIPMGERFSSSSASYINLALKSNGTPVVGYNGIIVQQYSGLTNTMEWASNKSFIIFPNPNTGQFSMDIPGSENEPTNIEIWTAEGKLIHSFETYAGKQRFIQTGNLSPGMYLIKAANINFKAVQKMVVR